MKLFILITLFSLGLAAQSNAQPPAAISDTATDRASDSSFNIRATDNRAKIMLGIKGGLNRSNVFNASTATNADPVMGWVAGLFITMPINRWLGFQPELLYAQKGFKARGTISGDDYDFTRKTIYMDIPLLMQVKPGKSISIFAGPLLSFMLHRNDKFTAGNISDEQKRVITNGMIAKNLLGAECGADIYIQKVVGSIRAGWDLQNIDDRAVSNSRRYESSWIQVTVGYRF